MTATPSISRRARVGALLCSATVLTSIACSVPATAAAVAITNTGPDWSFPAAETRVADIAKSIRADVAYKQGYTGKGVGVALIDTGVVPVAGLTSGNIVNGPDLSLESQVPSLLRKDGYGHGTHMAGIIAGRDNTTGTGFRGIAPDAKLTSIKVGMSNGAVDVSQMLAAIDWVVEHRNDDPANPIRVINLSYGTDSLMQNPENPLSLALFNAWKAGIVVVVASGNTAGQVTMPATDFTPIVVGSSDPLGTTNPADDTLSDFVSWQGRQIDTLVPGRSVVSLRNPGSYADTTYPTARVGDRFFKGSGTSQAAAVVSGAVALILQRYPTATPRLIRFGLRTTSTALPKVTAVKYGALNLTQIFTGGIPASAGTFPGVSGTGSLQAARGTSIVTFGPEKTPLTGEKDIFGAFSSPAWAAASTAGTSWNGGSWMGRQWTGTGLTTATNGQANWAGATWAGRAWSGRAWSDISWSGRAWSGRAWSGTGFSGAAWSGTSWSGALWK
jgi:serine protease AprX